MSARGGVLSDVDVPDEVVPEFDIPEWAVVPVGFAPVAVVPVGPVRAPAFVLFAAPPVTSGVATPDSAGPDVV